VPKLGTLHAHSRGGVAKPKFSIVQNVDGETDGVLLEIHNESLAAECTVLARIHLDLGFALVIFLNEPAFAKSFDNLFKRGIKREAHKDGGVLGFALRSWRATIARGLCTFTTLYQWSSWLCD
jgi:hypothetical protein